MYHLEARRLRRRRWAIGIAVVAFAATGTGLGFGFSGSGSGGHHAGGLPGDGNASSATAVPPGVAMLDLTKSDKYGNIALVGSRMLLYGPASGAIEPSISATCYSAVVDPSTLALSNLRSASCADPAIEGKMVLPVMTVEPHVPFGKHGGMATVTVRISHVVAGSPEYRLGPVVMTFPQASDGAPEWVYGDGDLWLFDSYNPGGYDLFRISETTGAVVQRVRVPPIIAPQIAFDDDDLFLSPGVDSSATPNAVYHLAPGAETAVPVFSFARRADEYSPWMIASGHSVFLDVDQGGRTFTLWHLSGSAAHRVAHVALRGAVGNEVKGQGSSSTVVGGASGLWTVLPTSSGMRQQVIRLDPKSGASSIVAVLKPRYATNDALYVRWRAVLYRGSMYLLDPPTDAATYPYAPEGFSALYRITPKP